MTALHNRSQTTGHTMVMPGLILATLPEGEYCSAQREGTP